jgi:hypothetical protein
MDKTYENFNKRLNQILNDTKHILHLIGDKEGNAYTGTLLPKPENRKRDYIDPILNKLASTIDILEEKVIPRSTRKLNHLTRETLENLHKIMEDIRLEVSPSITKTEQYIDTDGTIKTMKSKGKPIHQSGIVFNSHSIIKYDKNDVLKLTYYSLIELYKEYGYYENEFKTKALQQIYNTFGKVFKGNPLTISLKGITKGGKSLIPKNIPSRKLNHPNFITFEDKLVSIST